MQYYNTLLHRHSVSSSEILTELSYLTAGSILLHRTINSNPFNQISFELIVSLRTNLI